MPQMRRTPGTDSRGSTKSATLTATSPSVQPMTETPVPLPATLADAYLAGLVAGIRLALERVERDRD